MKGKIVFYDVFYHFIFLYFSKACEVKFDLHIGKGDSKASQQVYQ